MRRAKLILETLDDVAGGSHSLPELEWLSAIRRGGLPEPTSQQLVPRQGGRYYLDADFDSYGVTVEINGAQHLDLPQRDLDDERRNEMVLGGRLVIDISSHTVRHDPGRAVLRTAGALYARGWRPTPAVDQRLRRLAAGPRAGLWPVTSHLSSTA